MEDGSKLSVPNEFINGFTTPEQSMWFITGSGQGSPKGGDVVNLPIQIIELRLE